MVVKPHELRTKSKEELFKTLDDLKRELSSARVQKVSANNAKSSKVGLLRKDVARVLTIINEKQREQLRLYYKGKKYYPLDLRPKKTRAIRRRLTEFEKSQETERQRKQRIHFGKRVFAVKA
ncbi:Ribosomal protein L29 domain-containing protein [Rozella allomycis CSF55]|uniref:Ribosomal protein L29 domain-containing protein n=1 Tax=Rozella allomycis (strain CSF55) TaxID=988480 RepID=A0A075ARA7_ROZAC|nr:Ribosomal protein L29 domain-containing protein [Rozella allomycis CSF55]|eukprot:EPZ32773.1 Ribosomal protein L29 domain-containing protein [Rozella allomycis CSF55]